MSEESTFRKCPHAASPQALCSVSFSLLPIASLSRAVISTYHSDRTPTEDTGTYNPHSGTLFHTLLSNTPFPLLHCFSLSHNDWRVHGGGVLASPVSFSGCNKRSAEASGKTAGPGKDEFYSRRRLFSTSNTQNGTM